MKSTELLNMIALLLGGLTFFLFGMSVMSGGLEEMAGGNLERTLKKVGKNDALGFSLGAGITVAIQSSSAMTVMLVGLVNSGILAFSDTFGMIMGSHVGTTLTAWILTLNANSGNNFFMVLLKPMTFAPILAFFGITMRMFSKRKQKQKLGDIFIGFAILMAGMSFMSSSMEGVKQYAEVILTLFAKYPIAAFLASTVFTGIIQSSAATVAIVQALAISTSMDLKVAIPLVVGANIGTCMTSLISSIGTSKNAKRVVAMHVYTNAIGGTVIMAAMYLVMIFSPSVLTVSATIFTVAIIHSLFNIFNTILFTPFKKPLLQLCEKTIKGDTKEHTVFLDERLFQNTPLAISECKRLVNEMAELTRTSMNKALKIVLNYDEYIANEIAKEEAMADKYEDRLGTYLVRLSGNSLNEADSHAVARMLHSLGDFERISDHALNICEVSLEIKKKNIEFSPEATAEIKNITNAVKEIINLTCDSFIADDIDAATHIEPLEQVIDRLNDKFKSNHVERLQNGECTIELGFVFSDLLTNYERVSDHCSNLAVFTMQLNMSSLDAHKYLKSLKSMDNPAFAKDYNMYLEKYGI